MSTKQKRDVGAEVKALNPWFHNLHLPNGVQTAPDHPLGDFPKFKWELFSSCLPEKMDNWRVLDIGCNAGFYSFQLAMRGANVLAIDSDEHYLAQAKWAAAQYKLESRITLRQMQVYELANTDEEFDLVLFMGVFYHLRYPLLALDLVARKVKNLLVFQSMMLPGEEVSQPTDELGMNDRATLLEPGWPKMAFIEHYFHGDPTNWWVPNRAAVEAMLRSAGMKILHHPEHEIFICQQHTPGPKWYDPPLKIRFT